MTVGSLVERAQEHLSRRNVPEVSANVEFLMAAALGISRGDLHLRQNQVITPQRHTRFWQWVIHRGRRMPLAYILGTQPFKGMELIVNPGVLIPRPETEELAEIAIDLAKRLINEGRKSPKILDIGTGSGCLALAMARALPTAEIVAIDISEKALRVAKTNALKQKLSSRIKFICSSQPKKDWKADLIVSNPPYIPTARLSRLEPEVLREPYVALDGGPDGLRVIRPIITQARKWLSPGGWLALEMDSRQGPRIQKLLNANGFSRVEMRKDLQGLNRFEIAQFQKAFSTK